MNGNNFDIKKVILILVGTTFICYFIGFSIIFSDWKNIKFNQIADFSINKKISTKSNEILNNETADNKTEQLSTNQTVSSDNNINENKAEKLQSIEKIDIQAAVAEVNVIPKGTDEVNVHMYGTAINGDNKPELQCYVSGTTLCIIEKKKTSVNVNNGNENIKLDVCVPSDYSKDMAVAAGVGDININGFKLERLDCNPSLGAVQINNITANNFNYNSGTGDLNAVSLHTKDTSLKASLGKIDVSDFTGNLTSTNSSGDTKVQYSSFDNNVDIRASLGQVQLVLPKNSQFSLDARTNLGNVKCDFPITVSGDKKDNQLQGKVGSDKNKVKLSGSMGDISVNYN